MSIILIAFAVGIIFLVTHKPGEAGSPITVTKEIVTYVHPQMNAAISPTEKLVATFKKGFAKPALGQVNIKAKSGPALPDPAINPNAHCRLAIAHLLSRPKSEWHNIGFFSWYAVPASKWSDFERIESWWIHQMTFSPYYKLPNVVPGSNGKLWWIHLDSYGWDSDSWASVAELDPYFTQPNIEPGLAEYLRQAAGYHPKEKDIKSGKIPVVAIVRADWFFRDTIETERSQSYYNLLYTKQRFGGTRYEWRTEKQTFTYKGGDYRYPDDSGRVVQAHKLTPGTRYEVELRFKKRVIAKGNRDFPANEDEFNAAFGIDKVQDFIKVEDINLRKGAVVSGSLDDPKKGSLVALHNRAIIIYDGFLGPAMKTIDTDVTAGETDYLEKSDQVIVENVVRKASEFLYALPNGGQAVFLANADGKRTEAAPPIFAHMKIDPTYVDVKNGAMCAECHAPDDGLIPPNDLVTDRYAKGIRKDFHGDYGKQQEYEAFYLGWKKQVPYYQSRYRTLIGQTTDRVGLKPWTGKDISLNIIRNRVWYDNPLDLKQAAKELGIPPDAARITFLNSPKIRLRDLVNGDTVPRQTWELELFHEAVNTAIVTFKGAK